MGFHVDTTGNVWLGSGTTGTTLANAIAAGPPNFYVTTTGSVVATAGTIGGISLNATDIQANYSSSTGFKIESDGDAFFNSVDIRIGGAVSEDPSTGKTTLDLGNSKIYEFNSDLYLNASDDVIVKDVLRLAETGESASEPSLLFGNQAATSGSQINPVAGITSSLVQANLHGGSSSTLARRLDVVNGSTHVMRFNSENDEVEIPGDIKLATSSDIYIGTDPGSNGDVLTKSGGNIVWASQSGNSHPDSDHTSFLDQTDGDARYVRIINQSAHSHTHDHDGDYVDTVSGSTDALTINGRNITLNFGTTGTRVAAGNHTHSSSNVSVSAGAVTSNAGYLLRTLSASNNVITYNRSDFGSGLKMNSQRPTSNNSSSVGISTIEYNEMHSRSGNFTFVYGANLGSSSQEIKTDITDLDLGLDFINDLSPKKYKYVSQVKEDDGKYGFGFIAEDIEQVLVDNSETDSKLFVDGRDDYSSYGRCAHELTCTCEDEDCCSYPTETYNADTGEHTSTEGCMFDAKCVQPCCTDIAGATIDGINYVHATEAECEEEFIVSQKHPSLKYDELIAPAVKAIQELSTQISDLTARVEALEG